MTVSGSVHIYPDGRIVQILHLKHFRDFWFDFEEAGVGYSGDRGRQIPLQLWTAMPNKVLTVQAQITRSLSTTHSISYGAEAGEHSCAWDIRKQGVHKDRITINMSRFKGGASEQVDLFVIVEGY